MTCSDCVLVILAIACLSQEDLELLLTHCHALAVLASPRHEHGAWPLAGWFSSIVPFRSCRELGTLAHLVHLVLGGEFLSLRNALTGVGLPSMIGCAATQCRLGLQNALLVGVVTLSKS
jgi:hypothetical protein